MRFEQLEDRRMLFVTYGGSAVWTTTDLTFSYSNMLDNWGSGLTNDQITQAVVEAMGVWASVTPLTFTQTGDSGPMPTSADSTYPAAGNPLIRWGHHPIDGNTGLNTLGHGYAPGTGGRDGDIHYDDGNTFTADGFLELAVHELGHALGLDHPNGDVADYDGDGDTECPGPFAAIMHACVGGVAPELWDYTALGTAFLLQDDINGIRSLYDAGLGYVLNSTGQLSVFGTAQTDIFNVSYDFGTNMLTVTNGVNSFTRTMSGVQQVAINGQGGDDLIFVNALPSHVITVVNGGAGNDNLTVRGSEGGDTLRLLNGTTAYNNNSAILFSDISSVTLSGHGGSDVLEVVQAPANLPITLNGGDLNDQFYLANGVSTGTIASAVTINGDNGNDTAYLAPNAPGSFSVINAPVSFNGGAGGDTLNVGSGGLHAVSGLVTFNAGALGEGNVINLYDGAHTFFVDYFIGESSITRDTPFFFGGVNYSGVGSITLDASQGPNTVTINATSISSAIVNGNGGSDNFIIGNGNNLAGGIGLFTGNGGEGIDTLTLNDSLSTHDLPWAILGDFSFDPQTVYLGLQAYDLEGYEGVSVLAGNGNNNFQINGTMAQNVTLHAGGGNDTIELNDVSNFRDFFTQNEDPPFNYTMDIEGGGGFNTLFVDDAVSINRSYVINPEQMTAFEGAPLGLRFDYDSFQSVTVQAGNFANDFLVFGTSPDIPFTHQMTLIGGSDSDIFEIRPHDDLGNLTINGNLGISGAGGADSLVVNDTLSSLPINYTFYNQFGPGTTNIGGLGAAGFGAASNIENITLSAGGGDDSFDINTFQSGSALAINGGGGGDFLNYGSTSVAGITNMASFHFNGQDGTDWFNFNNAATPDAWTYNRGIGSLGASSSAGANYFLTETSTEVMQISSGNQADSFLVNDVAAGTQVVINAGGGTDGLAFGWFTSNAESIQGPVAFYGEEGGGHVAVYDALDTTGDTYHLDHDSLGDRNGDNLFGPGGSLTFTDLVNFSDGIGLRVFNGSGADTIYAQPLPTARVSLNANNPTTAPGDALNLMLAHAADYVVTGTTNGTVTSSNLLPLDWTGIEEVIVDDDPAPELPGDFSGDGIVNAADYSLWRDNLGAVVTPYSGADADGNGVVDGADYDIWKANFGDTFPGAGSGAVARVEGTSSSLVNVSADASESILILSQPVIADFRDLGIERLDSPVRPALAKRLIARHLQDTFVDRVYEDLDRHHERRGKVESLAETLQNDIDGRSAFQLTDDIFDAFGASNTDAIVALA